MCYCQGVGVPVLTLKYNNKEYVIEDAILAKKINDVVPPCGGSGYTHAFSVDGIAMNVTDDSNYIEIIEMIAIQDSMLYPIR